MKVIEKIDLVGECDRQNAKGVKARVREKIGCVGESRNYGGMKKRE